MRDLREISRQGGILRHARYRLASKLGAVAQLAERFVRNEEVRGSIPLSSTDFALASPSAALSKCALAVRIEGPP